MQKIGLSILLIALFWAAAASGTNPPETIRWLKFNDGLARSKQAGKPLVIYFYSDTCPACAEMKKSTWKDTRVVTALNNQYIPVKVNVDSERQIAAMYKVYYLPTTWFIQPDGKPFGNRSGYIPPDMFLKILSFLPQ